MKRAQPELLVDLDDKLVRVLRHWAAVDAVLPSAHPLWLLAETNRAATEALVESLPVLRQRVQAVEQELELARAAYERQKGVVHEWVRAIERCVRAYMQGTAWMSLVERLPGRGQAYGFWWRAATGALVMWRLMEARPPPVAVGWPLELGHGATPEEFAQVVRAFEQTHLALAQAGVERKIARGGWLRAERQVTALLMAYGHGVRARLGQKGALVRSIPQVWPRHKPKRKAA